MEVIKSDDDECFVIIVGGEDKQKLCKREKKQVFKPKDADSAENEDTATTHDSDGKDKGKNQRQINRKQGLNSKNATSTIVTDCINTETTHDVQSIAVEGNERKQLKAKRKQVLCPKDDESTIIKECVNTAVTDDVDFKVDKGTKRKQIKVTNKQVSCSKNTNAKKAKAIPTKRSNVGHPKVTKYTEEDSGDVAVKATENNALKQLRNMTKKVVHPKDTKSTEEGIAVTHDDIEVKATKTYTQSERRSMRKKVVHRKDTKSTQEDTSGTQDVDVKTTVNATQRQLRSKNKRNLDLNNSDLLIIKDFKDATIINDVVKVNKRNQSKAKRKQVVRLKKTKSKKAKVTDTAVTYDATTGNDTQEQFGNNTNVVGLKNTNSIKVEVGEPPESSIKIDLYKEDCLDKLNDLKDNIKEELVLPTSKYDDYHSDDMDEDYCPDFKEDKCSDEETDSDIKKSYPKIKKRRNRTSHPQIKKQRYRMLQPEAQKSFINELRQQDPDLVEDEELLIDVLSRIMTTVKCPDPPDNFMILLEDKFQCEKCKVIRDTKMALARHWQERHGPRCLLCFACGVDFRSSTNLYKHEKRCTAPDASILLRARARNKHHRDMRIGRPFQLPSKAENSADIKSFISILCKQQPELAADRKLLLNTLCTKMEEVVPPEPPEDFYVMNENMFECATCGTKRDSLTALGRHWQDVHGPRYAFCFACGMDFRERNEEERLTYPCTLCTATFLCESSLTAHEYLHRGERPFVCPHCPAAYTSSGALSRHKRQHQEGLMFICDKCERTFKCRDSLKQHMNTHLPRSKYGCAHCDKRYAQRGALTRHVHMAHYNLPPPCACQLCPKRYPRMSLLKDHMLKAHGMNLISRGMFRRYLPHLSEKQLKASQVVKKPDLHVQSTAVSQEAVDNHKSEEVIDLVENYII